MPNKYTAIILLAFISTICVSERLNVQTKGGDAQWQAQSDGQNLENHNLPEKTDYKITFQEFRKKYNKRYSSQAEIEYRKNVFSYNLRKLNQHNRNPHRSYNMKPNVFLDVDTQEFRSIFTKTYRSNEQSKKIAEEIIVSSFYGEEDGEEDDGEKRQGEEMSDYEEDKESTVNEDSARHDAPSAEQKQKAIIGNRRLEMTIERTGPILGSSQRLSTNLNKTKKNQVILPPANASIDWQMYSGSVKYQGGCGSCYAFCYS